MSSLRSTRLLEEKVSIAVFMVCLMVLERTPSTSTLSLCEGALRGCAGDEGAIGC